MLAVALCLLCFVAAYAAARRSVVHGIGVTLAVGYVYGVARANLAQTSMHFLFDAALAGLYAAVLFRPGLREESRATRGLVIWVLVLCAWPLVLLVIPTQDWLVQLVGLRANTLVLPFLILGARLRNDEVAGLARWCAVLNLAAFGVAVVEYTAGLELFFPHNVNTDIMIYARNDLGTHHAYRIPATFTSSYAYAGTMVTTLPLLIGAWVQRSAAKVDRVILGLAIAASTVGVFMAASRMHALVLFGLIAVLLVSSRMRIWPRLGLALLLIGVGYVVAGSDRLQHFLTLQDTGYVSHRVDISASADFFEVVGAYPMGNGLGAGGTNMPYFLQKRLRDPVVIENDYARIALEQGLPGLALWVACLCWMFARRNFAHDDRWRMGKQLAWWCGVGYFGTAWIGLGLITFVPYAAILLLTTGWMIGGQTAVTVRRSADMLPAPSQALSYGRV